MTVAISFGIGIIVGACAGVIVAGLLSTNGRDE